MNRLARKLQTEDNDEVVLFFGEMAASLGRQQFALNPNHSYS